MLYGLGGQNNQIRRIGQDSGRLQFRFKDAPATV